MPAVPYISREDVSATLGGLIHFSTKPEPNSLRHLLLVDLRITTPHAPESDLIRDYAVREILVSEITAALNEHRAIFKLRPLEVHADIQEVVQEAAQAVAQSAPELLIWSLLYYRFVRSDLGFTVERLSELLALHPRSIPRYQNEGIELLTARLIHAEQNARVAQNRRRLYAALPYSGSLRLYGRDDLLRETHKKLGELSPPHLLITGSVGVGKTAFTQELLRLEIEAGSLDRILWIDHPVTAAFVSQHISETLFQEGSSVTLREYLLLFRIAVVLDGADRLFSDDTALHELLQDLGGALVCITNLTYRPLKGINLHLALPEIDRNAARRLVSDLSLHEDIDTAAQLSDALYARVGGNPLALKLGAGLWATDEPWASVAHDLTFHVLSLIYRGLGNKAQRAWCLLALCRTEVTPVTLASWNVALDAITLLRRHELVEGRVTDGARLLDAAGDFIQQQYQMDEAVTWQIDQLVEQVAQAENALALVEQILVSGFPPVSHALRTGWLKRYCWEGMQANHWALWRALLEQYLLETPMPDFMLRIAHGVCLRRLNEWESAGQVFHSVIRDAGSAGRFTEQGRALVEWGVLSGYQGAFKQAAQKIEQAKLFAQRAKDSDLLTEVWLQEAYLLVLQGDGAAALDTLRHTRENARSLALQSEAQLVLGAFEACRALAERALRLGNNDLINSARLFTLIGRSFQAQNALAQAQQHLTYAVTLLERSDDLFSLARAQTNLAAVLISSERFTDASALLARAEQVQGQLGDRVGLSVTRHNRTLLASRFAG